MFVFILEDYLKRMRLIKALESSRHLLEMDEKAVVSSEKTRIDSPTVESPSSSATVNPTSSRGSAPCADSVSIHRSSARCETHLAENSTYPFRPPHSVHDDLGYPSSSLTTQPKVVHTEVKLTGFQQRLPQQPIDKSGRGVLDPALALLENLAQEKRRKTMIETRKPVSRKQKVKVVSLKATSSSSSLIRGGQRNSGDTVKLQKEMSSSKQAELQRLLERSLDLQQKLREYYNPNLETDINRKVTGSRVEFHPDRSIKSFRSRLRNRDEDTKSHSYNRLDKSHEQYRYRSDETQKSHRSRDRRSRSRSEDRSRHKRRSSDRARSQDDISRDRHGKTSSRDRETKKRRKTIVGTTRKLLRPREREKGRSDRSSRDWNSDFSSNSKDDRSERERSRSRSRPTSLHGRKTRKLPSIDKLPPKKRRFSATTSASNFTSTDEKPRNRRIIEIEPRKHPTDSVLSKAVFLESTDRQMKLSAVPDLAVPLGSAPSPMCWPPTESMFPSNLTGGGDPYLEPIDQDSDAEEEDKRHPPGLFPKFPEDYPPVFPPMQVCQPKPIPTADSMEPNTFLENDNVQQQRQKQNQGPTSNYRSAESETQTSCRTHSIDFNDKIHSNEFSSQKSNSETPFSPEKGSSDAKESETDEDIKNANKLWKNRAKLAKQSPLISVPPVPLKSIPFIDFEQDAGHPVPLFELVDSDSESESAVEGPAEMLQSTKTDGADVPHSDTTPQTSKVQSARLQSHYRVRTLRAAKLTLKQLKKQREKLIRQQAETSGSSSVKLTGTKNQETSGNMHPKASNMQITDDLQIPKSVEVSNLIRPNKPTQLTPKAMEENPNPPQPRPENDLFGVGSLMNYLQSNYSEGDATKKKKNKKKKKTAQRNSSFPSYAVSQDGPRTATNEDELVQKIANEVLKSCQQQSGLSSSINPELVSTLTSQVLKNLHKTSTAEATTERVGDEFRRLKLWKGKNAVGANFLGCNKIYNCKPITLKYSTPDISLADVDEEFVVVLHALREIERKVAVKVGGSVQMVTDIEDFSMRWTTAGHQVPKHSKILQEIDQIICRHKWTVVVEYRL